MGTSVYDATRTDIGYLFHCLMTGVWQGSV
jgi:hypothetical protein